MTDERTVTLGDELDRLDAAAEELVPQLDDAEPGTASTAMLKSEALDLDQAGKAVAELVDEYGPDATVTVREIHAGRFARIEDRNADLQASKDGPGGTPGSSKIVYAAEGLVDAPFYDGEPDDLDAKMAAVSTQSVGVRKWLEDLLDGGEDESGNWQPLAERLQDRDAHT